MPPEIEGGDALLGPAPTTDEDTRMRRCESKMPPLAPDDENCIPSMALNCQLKEVEEVRLSRCLIPSA